MTINIQSAARPSRARAVLARFATYAVRLRLWARVLSEIRFVKSDDGRNHLLRSILFAPISSLRGLGEFRNLVLLGDCRVAAKGIGQFQVRAHSDDLYVVLPSSEASVLEYIQGRLRPGDTFVDAGANIGIYTVAASRLVGPQGQVVAIEMMPRTFRQLHLNVELNDCANVRLVNQAISDISGQIVHVNVPADGRHGKASILDEASAGKEVETEEVSTETLEDMLRDFSRIRLIKMDLEGAEALAIKGAGAALDRVDAIVFETWDEQHDATALLEARGFRVRSLDERNRIAERQG